MEILAKLTISVDFLMNSETPETEEVVLLIHGTGAADENDSGDKWWQRPKGAKENFSKKLSDRLPVHIKVSNEIFHWGGRNKETDRSAAAQALYEDWMCRFEREGRPYHLIGHSHGGTVVWKALQLATERKHPIEKLKSWSTVGTPFFHYRSHWGVLALLKILFGLAAAIVIVGIFLNLTLLISFLVGGWDVSSFPIDEGIRIAVFFVPPLIGLFLIIAVLGEAWAILMNRLFKPRDPLKLVGNRWLGLRSANDEAINGLRRTLEVEELSQLLRKVKEQQRKPMKTSKPTWSQTWREVWRTNWSTFGRLGRTMMITWFAGAIGFSAWLTWHVLTSLDQVDYIFALSITLALLVIFAFFFFLGSIRLLTDSIIEYLVKDKVSRSLQGNDGESWKHVTEVAVGPRPSEAYPSLPQSIEDELTEVSDAHLVAHPVPWTQV